MNHLQAISNANICLSGGATGADLEWGSCASRLGHSVIHWSFPGHESPVPESQLVRLTDEELYTEEIDDALHSAARALGKTPPRKRGIARLLRRNYYQVARGGMCFAVTGGALNIMSEHEHESEDEDKKGVVRAKAKRGGGGTAWATVMFAQVHPGTENLYLFDMELDGWFQYVSDINKETGLDFGNGVWVRIERPPRPRGVWAGIGSRELRGNGRDAIRKLMGC